MKTKLAIFATILGLQAAWVLATCAVQERSLAQGTVILLETRPVDPRDLLRGDYVTLRYKISDVPLNLFSPPRTEAIPPGASVYVALERRGEYFEVVRASLEPIQPRRGEVALKGRSGEWWGSAAGRSVRLDYGLERYYVREGTGNPQGKVTVQAAVPPSGQGVIKEVLVDGKPSKA